ncbi:MAG: DUF1549 domain-containing protein [Pirellulales bacterium]
MQLARLTLANFLTLAWIMGSIGAQTCIAEDEPTDREPAKQLMSVQSLSRSIDQAVQAGYQKANVTSTSTCSDEQFVRRVYLDLVGHIPTTAERTSFLADGRTDKREQLVDTLLGSEDHVQHFADTFDTLMMGRTQPDKYHKRSQHWRPYLERVFRENRPWNQVAREILLARPQSPQEQGSVWFLFERNDNYQAIAEAVAPTFFGMRIDCAQCHDHMIASEIEQSHYWGLVAFFNRGKNQQTKAGPRVVESAIGGFSDFANLRGSSSPNLLTFFQAKVVDEARPEKDAKQEERDELYQTSPIADEPRIPLFSRREKFVDEILKDHPLLARSMVNRLWAMLLGRGLVHPFDQMNSAHEPSHPELLDLLAEDFRQSGYDSRRIVRAIVNSRAYQLDSRKPPGVEDPAMFAWALEKPLTAEQLSRSIQISFRNRFENNHALLTELRSKLPDVMPENIVTNISDALYLSNNHHLTKFIAESSGEQDLLGRISKLSDHELAAKELVMAFFGRQPDEAERNELRSYLARHLPASTDGSEPSSSKSNVENTDSNSLMSARVRVWQQIAWALMTSAEFRFNH